MGPATKGLRKNWKNNRAGEDLCLFAFLPADIFGKIFHDHGGDSNYGKEEYQKNPTGRDTEFYRGKVIGWRHALHSFYGDYASDLIQRARETAKLTIPHAGPLTPDGTGYVGWDSDADTSIGKLE